MGLSLQGLSGISDLGLGDKPHVVDEETESEQGDMACPRSCGSEKARTYCRTAHHWEISKPQAQGRTWAGSRVTSNGHQIYNVRWGKDGPCLNTSPSPEGVGLSLPQQGAMVT